MSDEFNRELRLGETMRASAQYARVGGRWYESAHRFSGDYPVDQEMTLCSPFTRRVTATPGRD